MIAHKGVAVQKSLKTIVLEESAFFPFHHKVVTQKWPIMCRQGLYRLERHIFPVWISACVWYYTILQISSSSGRAGSTDRHDSPPPLLPIRHRSRQVLRVASRILAELLDVGLLRSTRSGASMRGGPQEHVAYQFTASPAMSGVSCSSLSYGLCDRGQVSVQLFFCRVLLPGFVQGSTQHPGTTSIYFIL